MAITIDWPNKIINVPKADMLLLQSSPSEIRQLDMNDFRLTLKDLEDDEAGMPWPTTHTHNTTVTVSGATLARVVQFINGYTVTFEDGQYRVNVVGANTNLGEVTNVNQVSVSTSNSAGLQDLNSLQAASFAGGVAIKPSSIYSGTVFPVGTRGFPVNNVTDARTIAEERGINTFFVMESLTIASETLDTGYVFYGDSPVTVTITVDPSADVQQAEFRNATVTGTLDGDCIFRDCVVGDVDYVNGFIFDSSLTGTITLGGGTQANLFSCYSGVAGGGPGQYPTIDMNGNEQNSLAVRGFSGGLALTNNTVPAGDISIDFESGRLIVNSSITDGDIYVRGICDIDDQSGGSAVVHDQTITKDVADLATNTSTAATEATTARKLIDADEVLTEAGSSNWQLVDADDGVTVLRTRTVKDKNGDPITIPDGSPATRTKV